LQSAMSANSAGADLIRPSDDFRVCAGADIELIRQQTGVPVTITGEQLPKLATYRGPRFLQFGFPSSSPWSPGTVSIMQLRTSVLQLATLQGAATSARQGRGRSATTASRA